MRRFLVFILLYVSLTTGAQTYVWKAADMDGSRTGCKAATADNIEQALGRFQGDTYIAPNGKAFQGNTATAAVARIVLDAQPKLAGVKKVIAHSACEMPNAKYETMLSRWFVDIVMEKVARMSGKTVDVGICNFGGIRIGMPQGDVMLDDILSMFPFRNNLVYLELEGWRLRKIFENMAAGKFQAVGGVKIIVEDRKLTSVYVGGEPLDDTRVYGVATISFLLHGGDGLTLSDGASDLNVYDVYVADAVLEHLACLSARGESVKGNDERCVIIK